MSARLVRNWGDDFELQALLADAPGGADFAVRDLALLTLAAKLSTEFLGQLVFKGGFVLRHCHGVNRFSRDVDATRHAPPHHKLEADDVARAIAAASIGDQLRFKPGEPESDGRHSLDFASVEVRGALIEPHYVAVEVSYREAVVDPPIAHRIGAPYFAPFEILALAPSEMAAEKLRTLAQRVRATDLADLAQLLELSEVKDADVARLAKMKFEIVKRGTANRAQRIERNLRAIGDDYDDVVPQLAPDAPSYRDACGLVWPRIKPLIPA